MARLRAAAITAVFFIVTLLLMPVQWLFLKLRLPAARSFPHFYHRLVAGLFGIHITVVGKKVSGEGVLLVANHTSWADIIIFSAVAFPVIIMGSFLEISKIAIATYLHDKWK